MIIRNPVGKTADDEHVSCVHTAQGLEFDYVGVIVGDDLKYAFLDGKKVESGDLSDESASVLPELIEASAIKFVHKFIRIFTFTQTTGGCFHFKGSGKADTLNESYDQLHLPKEFS